MLTRFFSRGFSNGFSVGSLNNGVKLASVNAVKEGPFASIGILVKTGHITGKNPASPLATTSSYIMEKLAFKVISN